MYIINVGTHYAYSYHKNMHKSLMYFNFIYYTFKPTENRITENKNHASD